MTFVIRRQYFSNTNSLVDRNTLRLHRRLREIAGFRAATLPGLEHTLALQCGFWVNRAWQVLHDEAYRLSTGAAQAAPVSQRTTSGAGDRETRRLEATS